MIEKWERQPGRVGIIAGCIALPFLWFLHEQLLTSTFNIRSSSGYELTNFYVAGVIPGAVIGLGLSKAALASRRGNLADMKRYLLLCSGSVLILSSLLVAVTSRSDLLIDIALNFPLHCALLMFLIGLLVRSRR